MKLRNEIRIKLRMMVPMILKQILRIRTCPFGATAQTMININTATQEIKMWELCMAMARAKNTAKIKRSIKYGVRKSNQQIRKIQLVKISGMIHEANLETSVMSTSMVRTISEMHSISGVSL